MAMVSEVAFVGGSRESRGCLSRGTRGGCRVPRADGIAGAAVVVSVVAAPELIPMRRTMLIAVPVIPEAAPAGASLATHLGDPWNGGP